MTIFFTELNTTINRTLTQQVHAGKSINMQINFVFYKLNLTSRINSKKRII